MDEWNAIVVGAGVWGCTVARRLAEAGRKVLVIERRAAIGGNARCETDSETGIEVHVYGSHIFHTHNRQVWDFVRRFTEFNGYQHKVLACYRGRHFFLPIGLALLNKFFDVELKPAEVRAFMADPTHAVAVFDAFFRGYTAKQWGLPPEQVDPAVIRRVPVRENYDTNYFNDYWQGIPDGGYNRLFEKMLEHHNITIHCGTDFDLSMMSAFSPSMRVFYSGPLDRLFEYRFGALPWRSLRFEVEKLDTIDFQGTSVVNFAEASVPQTRIHEFKHYHPERVEAMRAPKTIVMREYPMDWKRGDEPYYPIAGAASTALLERYRAEAAKVPNLVVGGRLGDYCYYDMDQAMAAALGVTL